MIAIISNNRYKNIMIFKVISFVIWHIEILSLLNPVLLSREMQSDNAYIQRDISNNKDHYLNDSGLYYGGCSFDSIILFLYFPVIKEWFFEINIFLQ
jgi:hypothetical protein